MFDHLKAEEFVNLIEGVAIPADRRAHAEVCQRCQETWKTLQPVYSKVTTLEQDVVEPDWSEFRASVRDEMLSRAVQRQTAGRRWAIWPLQPAAVWAFSLFLAVGLTAGVFFWGQGPDAEPVPVVENVEAVSPDAAVDPVIELQGIDAEMK